ncbi:MAG: polymerase sigma factor [Betaproteobacteria bacterium]|nr:polymerase sigma factor [Betaproteobacteria bacterium]
MKTASSTSPGSASSDLALVRQTLQGDDKAFELIMRRNNRTLYRAARAILLDDADAEDAVQEAYLRAYRALGGFEGEARLTTWLTRIVINEALERLRKRKREAGTVSLENVVDLEMHMNDTSNGNAGGRRAEGPESAAMRAQTRRLLEQKIDQLPSAFRTVFILRALEEMSVEETAACLDLNGATVRTRYFRAKSLLRESLAKEIDLVFEDAFAFAGDRCDRIVNTVLERVRLLRAKR